MDEKNKKMFTDILNKNGVELGEKQKTLHEKRGEEGKRELSLPYDKREEDRKEGKEGVLERYNTVLSEILHVKDSNNKVINDYEKLHEGNEKFEITFTGEDKGGNFFAIDGKWKVILSNEKFRMLDIQDGDAEKFLMLGTPVTVKIESIHRAGHGVGGEVYVDLAGVTKWEKQTDLRKSVVNEIERGLSKGVKVRVLGKVVVNRGYDLTIDIMGLKITGIIKASAWRKTYSPSLTGIVSIGEWYEFHVENRLPKKPNTKTGYRLSRVAFSDDDWKESGITDLLVNDRIVVKCVDIPYGKSYWYGVTEQLKGVMVQCDYTSKFPMDNGIYVGTSYICSVVKVEEWVNGEYVPFNYSADRKWHNDGYRITVKPLEVVEADMDIYYKKRDLPPIKRFR